MAIRLRSALIGRACVIFRNQSIKKSPQDANYDYNKNDSFVNRPMSNPITKTLFDDINLLDEIDEILRNRLVELERNGASIAELNEAAEQLGNMYDLIDAKVSGQAADAVQSDEFKESTYQFLVDRFMERIQAVYDVDHPLPPEQTKLIVEQTRSKLRRVRRILFS